MIYKIENIIRDTTGAQWDGCASFSYTGGGSYEYIGRFDENIDYIYLIDHLREIFDMKVIYFQY